MTITPAFGLAPLDGLTPIKVEITPSEIIKFDAKVMIQIRGSKMLELRLSGESEEPLIDISMVRYLLIAIVCLLFYFNVFLSRHLILEEFIQALHVLFHSSLQIK
jgi:hypothetical protein